MDTQFQAIQLPGWHTIIHKVIFDKLGGHIGITTDAAIAAIMLSQMVESQSHFDIPGRSR